MSGSKDCVLAIDLGTSGPKVAVVTLDAEVLGWQTGSVALSLSPGGGAEQDPADWWQSICGAARTVLERTGAAARVVAVAVTCHWCGTVAVDAEGTPLRPAIIWLDTRGARYVPQVCGGVIKVEGYGLGKLAKWIRMTGGIPSLAGKEPVAHLLWLRHNEPEIHRKATLFLEPKDWLNFKLTGVFAATYDSIALHWATDNRRLDAIADQRVVLGERRQGVVRGALPADERVVAEQVGGLLGEPALQVRLTGEQRRYPQLFADQVRDQVGDRPAG